MRVKAILLTSVYFGMHCDALIVEMTFATCSGEGKEGNQCLFTKETNYGLDYGTLQGCIMGTFYITRTGIAQEAEDDKLGIGIGK